VAWSFMQRCCNPVFSIWCLLSLPLSGWHSLAGHIYAVGYVVRGYMFVFECFMFGSCAVLAVCECGVLEC
jgi:hypothetical protein